MVRSDGLQLDGWNIFGESGMRRNHRSSNVIQSPSVVISADGDRCEKEGRDGGGSVISQIVDKIIIRQSGIHFRGNERRGQDRVDDRVVLALSMAGWMVRRSGDKISWMVSNLREMRMMLNFLMSSTDQF